MSTRIHELRPLVACAALAVSLAPSWARADAPPGADAAATTDAAATSSGSAAPASDAASDALARFAEGQRLYDAQQYEPALAAFSASYALVASPNSRLYVARCLRELGRLPQAWDEYARVADEAASRAVTEPRYAETEDAARQEREALRSKLAFLRIHMPAAVPSATLAIRGELVPASRWGDTITVPAGATEIRALAPGRRAFVLVSQLRGGEERDVDVDLPDVARPVIAAATQAAPERPFRAFGLASAGVGVAGLATWAIFGLAASSRYAGLVATCAGRCGPDHADDVAAGRRESTTANVGLVVGLVGVAGGAALLTYDHLHAPAPSKVRVGVGPLSMSLEGAF